MMMRRRKKGAEGRGEERGPKGRSLGQAHNTSSTFSSFCPRRSRRRRRRSRRRRRRHVKASSLNRKA